MTSNFLEGRGLMLSGTSIKKNSGREREGVQKSIFLYEVFMNSVFKTYFKKPMELLRYTNYYAILNFIYSIFEYDSVPFSYKKMRLYSL